MSKGKDLIKGLNANEEKHKSTLIQLKSSMDDLKKKMDEDNKAFKSMQTQYNEISEMSTEEFVKKYPN